MMVLRRIKKRLSKEPWWVTGILIGLTSVAMWAIGFGIVEWFRAEGVHPRWLVAFGFFLLLLLVAYKAVRTPTSVGNTISRRRK